MSQENKDIQMSVLNSPSILIIDDCNRDTQGLGPLLRKAAQQVVIALHGHQRTEFGMALIKKFVQNFDGEINLTPQGVKIHDGEGWAQVELILKLGT